MDEIVCTNMNVRFVMEGENGTSKTNETKRPIITALESNFNAMIESLQPEQMVIDQVIDLYCKELERRYPFPNTRILHSQFFTLLPNRKQRYFKNNELATMDFLFFPIFDDQMNHWRLAVVELLRLPTENDQMNLYIIVSVLDSVRIHQEHARSIALNLSRFVANESVGQFANVYSEFNTPNCPRQTNCHDCGLFTMFFIRECRNHISHVRRKQQLHVQSKHQLQFHERESILQEYPVQYSMDHFLERENVIVFVKNTFLALQRANVSGTDLDVDLQELLNSIEERSDQERSDQERRDQERSDQEENEKKKEKEESN